MTLDKEIATDTMPSLNTKRVHSAAEFVKNEYLKTVANAYTENIDNLDFLLITPHILLSFGYSESACFNFFAKKVDYNEVRGEGFEKWYGCLTDKVRELADSEKGKQEFTDHLKVIANRKFQELESDKKVSSSIRLIQLFALASGWAFFESAASDAWEIAVNQRPLALGHKALVNIPQDQLDDDGIKAKSVSVGLLARHNFDLRKSFGSVLKFKFDFTSVSGILKAYRAVFGKLKEVEDVLSNPELSRLEATRHLIVHRAGIIDEEFKKRTGITANIGDYLVAAKNDIESLLDTSIEAGSVILENGNSSAPFSKKAIFS